MKNPGHDLHAVNQARAGPAEEGIAVDHPDLAKQPLQRRLRGPELYDAPFERKSAGRYDHHLGSGIDRILPSNGMGRPARGSQRVPAARLLGQPRSPMPTVERRIDPLQRHHSPDRSAGYSIADRRQSVLEPGHHLLGPGVPPGQAPNQPNVVEKIGQTFRLERDQLRSLRVPSRGALHNRIGDGAHLARSEEHTSELQSRSDLVCRLLLEKKKKKRKDTERRKKKKKKTGKQMYDHNDV